MDNTNKYLYIKLGDKNAYEMVDEIMAQYKSPLIAIKKIREKFPFLSLMEAKEIVVINISNHKSLYDYQGSLFPGLEEVIRIIDEENN